MGGNNKICNLSSKPICVLYKTQDITDRYCYMYIVHIPSAGRTHSGLYPAYVPETVTNFACNLSKSEVT